MSDDKSYTIQTTIEAVRQDGRKQTEIETTGTVVGWINELHALAVRSAQCAINYARQAGELLIKAKHDLPHGEWLPWLQTNCPTISERTAQRYMKIAENWAAIEAKAPGVSDLPIREALKLLAEPRPTARDASGSSLALFQRFALAERLAKAQLAVLAEELQRDDITIPEIQAVIDRVTEIEQDCYERNIRGLAEFGRVLNAARDQYGDDIAEQLRKHPAVLVDREEKNYPLFGADREAVGAVTDTFGAFIHPSTSKGFFYVTILNLDAGTMDGLSKPIRREMVDFALEQFNFPITSARWNYRPIAQVWARNEMLADPLEAQA